MNPRIHGERTPARRLAALLREYLNRFLDPPPAVPDYADIHQDIELYVHREEFAIRLQEIAEAALGTRGTDAQEYFRKRTIELQTLDRLNEQEITRNGLL